MIRNRPFWALTSRSPRLLCAPVGCCVTSPCAFFTAYRFAASAGSGSSNSNSSMKAKKNMFNAPPNVGSGRPSNEANPFKSWEHMNHTWLILMCVGCLCAGMLAGQIAEVDESQLKPKFSKSAVLQAATKELEFRPDLAATSIRVAFVLAARRAGFPADTVDESCAVADGLTDVAGVLNYLCTTFNASMEDIVSLMAIASVKFLNGPCEEVEDKWRWGRNDTDDAPNRNVPTDKTKGDLFSIPTILHGLGDLTEEECVALMACHSVGEFHENVSGIDGVSHIGKRFTLSNAYYQFLLDHEKKFSKLEVPRTEDNKEVATLPAAMSYTYAEGRGKKKKRQCAINTAEVEVMLKGKAWRPIVEKFARDEEAWQRSFQSAFHKMLEGGFRKLRVYSDPDAPTPTDTTAATTVSA